MKVLGVRCRSCGQVFGTGILVAVYGRPALGPFARSCPAGHAGVYTGAECVEIQP